MTCTFGHANYQEIEGKLMQTVDWDLACLVLSVEHIMVIIIYGRSQYGCPGLPSDLDIISILQILSN